MQLISFVRALYVFASPLFYNHHICEGDVPIIPFTMGTCQDDPLGGALFAFRALHSIVSHFPSFLFPSIVDDIRIINPLSIVSSTYEHFQTKLHELGIFIQPRKCVAWSPSSLPLNLTPHASLPPHQKELEFWEFHWALYHSHHCSSNIPYYRMFKMWIISLEWVMFR
jgi:hypothetical protein